MVGGGYALNSGTVSQSQSHKVESDEANAQWTFTWTRTGGSSATVTPYVFCATP